MCNEKSEADNNSGEEFKRMKNEQVTEIQKDDNL